VNLSSIPSGWREVSLGEICEFAYGKSLPAKSRSEEGFPVYGSNGIVGFHQHPLTDSQTIVIGRKGSYGEVNLSSGPCFPIDTTYYVTNNQTNAYLPWLARLLVTLGLNRLNKAAAVPGLNRDDAYRKKLLLPPLEEQKRIATILDAADALRAKRRESIEQLDKLAQSVFIDMFGDPVTNPMGWNVRELSKACSKITDGTHHSPPVLEEGIPYVTAKHLKSDGLKFFDDPWFISPERHAEIFARCNPEAGDVLYIKDGATTGIAAINQYDFDFSMLSSLALLKPNRKVVSSEYLAAYLNNQRNKAHLIGNMGGAAIKRLTLAKIKKFRIPLPPIEMQNRFSQIFSRIEGQRSKMSSCVVELDFLFASLQSKAFSGNL